MPTQKVLECILGHRLLCADDDSSRDIINTFDEAGWGGNGGNDGCEKAAGEGVSAK
jgi:hypothetical protein